MPRKPLIRTDQFPYHIVNRANNKEWFAIPLEEVWSIAMKSFRRAQQLYPVEVHAFVLMSNHYHMILSTPNSDVDKFMQIFNKRFSEYLKQASGRINRMFGGPYKWTLINSEVYLYNVFRYIYQNPMRAGLVDSCENYPFSTLHYEIKNKDKLVRTIEKLDCEKFELLKWYNKPVDKRKSDCIRRGLKYQYFEAKADRQTKYKPLFQKPQLF